MPSTRNALTSPACRYPNYEAEANVLRRLARALATSDAAMLNALGLEAARLCRADSAGISVLESPPAFGSPGNPAMAGSDWPCGSSLWMFANSAGIRRTSQPTQSSSLCANVQATRITSLFENAMHFVDMSLFP